jgi:hypothetical protein
MVWQKDAGPPISAGCITCVVIFGSVWIRDVAADDARAALAQQGVRVEYANLPEAFPQDESLEAKWARRFPQKVKVGDLLGLPVLDDDNSTLGHVQQVVRSPEGRMGVIPK